MEFVFGGTMLFWIALALLATVVPMRLVAEELRSGTIEPLLTAPVSAAEVVLGKWLAALAFFAAALGADAALLVYLRASAPRLDAGRDRGRLPRHGAARRREPGGRPRRVGGDAQPAAGRGAVVRRVLRRAAARRARGAGARARAGRRPPPRQPVAHDGGLRPRHRRLAPRGAAGDRHRRGAADRDRVARARCAARCPPMRRARAGCPGG